MAIETLQEISEAEAVARLGRVTDPTGPTTPETLAAAGTAFELVTEAGQGVFVCSARGSRLWVDAAQGEGQGLTAEGLPLVEQIAKCADLSEVGFQTARPGLVRLAQARGYEVTGWILSKKL